MGLSLGVLGFGFRVGCLGLGGFGSRFEGVGLGFWGVWGEGVRGFEVLTLCTLQPEGLGRAQVPFFLTSTLHSLRSLGSWLGFPSKSP